MPVDALSGNRNTFIARWLLLSCGLIAVQLALAFLFNGTAQQWSRLTPSPTTVLQVREVIALIATSAVLAAISSTWLAAIPISVTACIGASGWMTFLLVGAFPGMASLRMFQTTPRAVILHGLQIDSSAVVGAGVGAILLSMCLILIHRIRWKAPAWVLLIPLTSLLVLGSYASTASGRLERSRRVAYDPATGVTRSWHLLWGEAQLVGGGAFSTILASIWNEWHGTEDDFPRLDPDVQVLRPLQQTAVSGIQSRHRRLNVLILVIESLRSDVLLAGGAHEVTMPAVEAIGTESRRFRNAYTTATQTNLASVVPVSGQYPLRTRDPRSFPTQPDYPRTLLWDVVRPLGWRTAVFSSQNERWWGMRNFLSSARLDTLFDAEAHPAGTYLPTTDDGFARFVREGKTSGKLYDGVTVHSALNWIGNQANEPFVMLINLQSSHLPYQTPSSAARVYGRPLDFPVHFGTWPKDSIDRVFQEYRNALAYIDEQVGLLRDNLIAIGQWDSTIVIITGDHGQAFYEHGIAAHANGLWQELARVPLFIKAPGIQPGTDDREVSHIDITPTVVALLGIDESGLWPGIRLDRPSDEARPLFLMVQSPIARQTAVLLEGWKLIRNQVTGELMLFDTQCDATESQDLTSTHQEQLHRLSGLLGTWERAQLDYYESRIRKDTELPPRFHLKSSTARTGSFGAPCPRT